MSTEEKKPEEGGVAGETDAGSCDCDYRTLVGVFKALSDESRQKILLALEEEGEMRVADLVKRFHISQPTMSHHLGVLRNSGLVNDRREGQSVYYSVNRRWLSDCCGGYLSRFDFDED
ncbi:transcriptional repressor SdpR [bacterium BMS3Abin01]|nr:transcriptional repressor SdpR [bacterium BMS3Abin01]